ncbi:MAG TPA: ribonuclease III [Firmicutes bacterium]|nr:ribonuclease III [Bacillota bacterium]
MNFLKNYGIKIKNEDLLKVALTHPSYTNEHGGENYERLEYLGDAVLELAVSEYLFANRDLSEGDMTSLRSRFVCEAANYEYANKIGIIPFIKLGNGQLTVNDTIGADVFEAVLGVVFLECGYEVTKKFILKVVAPYIESDYKFYTNYKSLLQEMIQTSKKSLEYVEISESGPAHDKTFTFEVRVDGIIYGRGTGHSKKEAEQEAAKDAYMKAASGKE